MAEKGGTEGKAEAKRNWSIWFIIFVVLLILITAGVTSFYMLGGSFAGLASGDPWGGQNRTEAQRDSLGPLVEMDEFVVNIDDGDRTRFLKTGITLEVRDSRSREEIEHRMPQIRDTVLSRASSKSYREVRDMQGKKQLRMEIQQEINSILSQGEVRQVFFTEFVVQ